MQLSAHFSLDELTASQTATRKGIDNTPPADVMPAMQELANGLERVRRILGVPMQINSGYRSAKLNAAVGGSKTSQHCKGEAADFVAPQFGNPMEVCRAIVANADEIQFDQLIYEGAWIHISFTPDPRQSVLTAHFGNGGVKYSAGLP